MINKGLRSEINQLKIKCSNHRMGIGCEWMGELGALKTHLESEKGCEFVIMECPNKCKNYGILRKDLDKHLKLECPLRPYECEHCGIKDSYEKITSIVAPKYHLYGSHYDICPAYPLACPNNCGVISIKRKDMADHRSKCPQECIECPFTEAGCQVTLPRCQLKDHLSSSQQLQQHLLLVMGAYKQVKDQLRVTEAKLTTAVQLLRQGGEVDKETVDSIVTCLGHLKTTDDTLTVIMPQLSKYHHRGKMWHSPPFYFKEGYKCA